MFLFRWIRLLYVNSPIAAYFARKRILNNPSARRLERAKEARKERRRMAKAGVSPLRDYSTWTETPDVIMAYKSQLPLHEGHRKA